MVYSVNIAIFLMWLMTEIGLNSWSWHQNCGYPVEKFHFIHECILAHKWRLLNIISCRHLLLLNKLPHSFRKPHPHPGLSPSHYPTQVRSTLSSPPLSPSITPVFHSRLNTHLSQVFSTLDFSIYSLD